MTRPPGPARGGSLQVTGLLLFLFIPLVLFLFVGHPEPIGLSLALGVGLMLGHRFLARPYLVRALPAKCLWCNQNLPEQPTSLALETRGGPLTAFTCRHHRDPPARFFAFTHRWRWGLRAGIFVPLLGLLVALGLAAAGREAPVEAMTDAFRLLVGITVNVAALGTWLARGVEPAPVAFPAHNFSLLGVRALLWIFRLVGVWWIVAGGSSLWQTLVRL